MVVTLRGFSPIARLKSKHWEQQQSLTMKRTNPTLDEPISMMRLETRARRATTTIRTRHLLIPHCQEDHCTRMHANTSSLIHTWTFNFLSLFLSLAFRVLYLPCVPPFYPFLLFTLLPSTMAFLSSKPPKSLTRLKLIREVTVSSIARW